MKTRLLRNKMLAGGFGLLLALVLLFGTTLPAAAEDLPTFVVYKGTISLCGNPVSAGTIVESIVNGVLSDTTAVDNDSRYGYNPVDLFKAEGLPGQTIQLVVEGQVLLEETIPGAPASRDRDLVLKPKLTTSSTAGGTVTTPGIGTFGPYNCGESVALVATASGGYVFTHWSGNTTNIADVNSATTTITMNNNYSVVANFELEGAETFTLNISSTAGGSVTTPGEGDFGPYDPGDVVNLVATPALGYTFDGWTGETAGIANVNSATTTVTMNGNYTIVANFELEGVDTFTLTVSASAGGSVTTPGVGTFGPYDEGTVVNLVAVANSCYNFVNWTGDTAGIANVNSATTTITMNGNYNITANFAIKTFTLNISSSAGGDVTTPGEGVFGPYDCGQVVNLVAVADSCYNFVNWTGDTAGIANVNSATTTITVNGNYNITANFAIKTFNLTISSSAGGDVTTPGEGTFGPYNCGQVVNLVATPAGGYAFTNWTGDTGGIANVNSATTTITVNGNYSIVANFHLVTATTYSLTTSSTAGGDVTTPGEGTFGPYNEGTVVNLVATADPCYEFVNWTGDTAGIANVNSATTTITMNDNYSITANFVIKTFTLTISSTAGGDVTTPGEGAFGPYNCGQVVNLVATAVGCYNFVEWTGDTGTIASINGSITTITMNGNYTITANFQPAGELDIEIPFNAGWNTFSTPVSLHDCEDTWGEFLAVNDLEVDMIYVYDSNQQAWDTVNAGQNIIPLQGYYVKVKNAGVAHIIPNSEVTGPPSMQLKRGLNLIGIAPASLDVRDVVSALITLYEASNGQIGYTLVVSPFVNTPDDWAYSRGGTTLTIMKIGRAYWVIMENDDTYYGETTTPLKP